MLLVARLEWPWTKAAFIYAYSLGLHSNLMFFLFLGVYQYSIKIELNGSTFGILDLPIEV